MGKDKPFDWARGYWVVKGRVGSKVVRVIKTAANVSGHHSWGADYGPGLSQSLCMDKLLQSLHQPLEKDNAIIPYLIDEKTEAQKG